MKFDFKDIAWAAIVVGIVIFLSKCHRDKYYSLEAKQKDLINQAAKDSVLRQETVTRLEQRAHAAADTAAVYVAKLRVLGNTLDRQSASVLRLSAALKEARIIDTNVIGVGQEYLDYCDSLSDVSTSLAVGFNQYKKNNSFILAAYDRQLIFKDSIIGVERVALGKCKESFTALTKLYQEAQAKPRNQVYVGVELMGNQTYLVSNVGVALTIKSKSNKLWQISGGVQSNGGYYGRINGNILIKLKK